MDYKESVITEEIINEAKRLYPDIPDIEEITRKKLKYTDDHFFKYVTTHSSNIRNILCQYLLGEDIQIAKTIVTDTHTGKNSIHDKMGILDIAAVDNIGNHYNLEMQCYCIQPSDFKRFQYYAFKNVSSQLETSDKYHQLKPIYQLIINGSNKDALDLNHFEHSFIYYDVTHHKALPHNLYFTHYIQLHHIDELEDQNYLNAFMGLMLMFQSDGENDKIDVDVVRELKAMHEQYIQKRLDVMNAVSEEINRMYFEVRKEEAEELAYLRGKNITLTLISQYRQGILSLKECAEKLEMTEEEFLSLKL